MTPVVGTEAGAQAAAGAWRARPLLWLPARRSGGGVCVWVVSVGCCVFSVEVHGHRPRRSVTPAVDTEAGAQAASSGGGQHNKQYRDFGFEWQLTM